MCRCDTSIVSVESSILGVPFQYKSLAQQQKVKEMLIVTTSLLQQPGFLITRKSSHAYILYTEIFVLFCLSL